MHHALVIVRIANVKQVLQEYECRAQERERRAQRDLQEEGNHITISGYRA